MPNITYIEHDGTAHQVEAEAGLIMIESAANNDVSGIDPCKRRCDELH